MKGSSSNGLNRRADLREFTRDSVRRFLVAADEMMRAMREAESSLEKEEAIRTRAAPSAAVPSATASTVLP